MDVRRTVRLTAVLLSFGVPPIATAQSSQSATDTTAKPESATVHRGPMRKFWGDPAQNAAYALMGTLHLHHMHTGLASSRYFGATVRGIYAGTFVTSYGDRALTAGAERNWIAGNLSETWRMSWGYRVGLLYGYDAELMRLAGKTPVLPAAEMLLDVSYRKLGVQFGYAGIVATVGGYWRL
jgi:hypothetical protein